jgi:hypothetical protein
MLSNSDWHIISNDDVPAVKIKHMLILQCSTKRSREGGREGRRKFPKKGNIGGKPGVGEEEDDLAGSLSG